MNNTSRFKGKLILNIFMLKNQKDMITIMTGLV
jgi:hypothetical protein